MITEKKFQELVDSKIVPMPDQFVAIMVHPAEKSEQYPINILDTIKNQKDIEYSMYLKVTEENPNQWCVVAVGEDLKNLLEERDRVYITHRYYPIPFIHKGEILHRMCKSDVLAIIDTIPDFDEFYSVNRLDLNHAQVIKPQYERNPLKD